MWDEALEAVRILDRSEGATALLAERLSGTGVELRVHREESEKGASDFIHATVKGEEPGAPTLGVIGYLGGLSVSDRFALVSDADGAITAIACLLRAARERFTGTVIVTTHLCTRAIRVPHQSVHGVGPHPHAVWAQGCPVDFVNSPISQERTLELVVDEKMDAIVSIDTTRGNRVINQRGFAISPTVKEGYVLRVSEDLLDLMQSVTGKLPVVFPITTQDITPYSSGVYHLNSILQPATRTRAPVVGVALTSEAAVPGVATGATDVAAIESAARFVMEVARAFTAGRCRFYDSVELEKLVSRYGSLAHLQK